MKSPRQQEQEFLPFQEANTKTIEEFIDQLPPMSLKRQKKYRTILTHVSNWWLKKPFVEATKLDLKNVAVAINTKEDFTDWTKSDYRMATKRFFRWLRNAEFVQDIKTGRAGETVGPEDILTEDELSCLYSACTSLRDKALTMTAYESACRPHELLGLRKSDVVFDESGSILYVKRGKTGARRIRVVNASPLLSNWIENHPLKERDAPLWVDLSNNTKYSGLKWSGLRKVLLRLVERAHIQKPVTAYIFRHTRLTHLARSFTETQLCEFAGWRQGSKMPRMYIHFSGRDVDDALLRIYGMKNDVKPQHIEVPKKCVRCGTISDPLAQICSKCGMALTLQAVMKRDEEVGELRQQLLEMEQSTKRDREEVLAIAKQLSEKLAQIEAERLNERN